MDDFTILKIVDFLTVCLTSNNVPSEINVHNQFIPGPNLQYQTWLDEINNWIEKQKMQINEKKTQTLIFNITNYYIDGKKKI